MARSFSGTTNQILTTAPGVTGTAARSISVWFNTASVTGAGSNWVYTWGSGGTGTLWQVSVESGVVWVRCDGAGTVNGSFGSGYNDSKWHNLVITFPASGTMSQVQCYVDGASLTGTFTGGTTALNTGTTNKVKIAVGIQNSNKFAGSLAELAIWSVQLSAQEAAGLGTGRGPRHVRPGSILNYWPLWGLQSPEPDLGGSGFSGTLTGTSQANHAPVTLFTRKARAEVEPSGGSSLALGQQSASWTNPALSFLSAVALGQESAAWTDPALTFASSLALGQESAAWSNPAMAQAMALALAQQSASWTNPAITVPGGLQLAAQSLSATNPAITFLQQLALAAESAAWTDPALNAAFTLAVAQQAASWTNPAITPSSGGGSSVALGPQSAAWIANALGAFFCPTILNPYMARESCVISDVEVVTLYRRLSDGTFDGGQLIGQALRLDIGKQLGGGAAGLLSRNDLQWYLWDQQVGQPRIKDGDVIQDMLGVRWTVWRTDVQAWGNRYLVQTKQER